jgi:hypothetical protein
MKFVESHFRFFLKPLRPISRFKALWHVPNQYGIRKRQKRYLRISLAFSTKPLGSMRKPSLNKTRGPAGPRAFSQGEVQPPTVHPAQPSWEGD